MQYLRFSMCDVMNIEKCIKLIKIYILVLFRFFKKYDTMNVFITQLGIYMRDCRV